MSLAKRAENIKAHVSLLDVMRDAGHLSDVTAKGEDFQLRCPFHGKDNKASAHVYPDPPHFHCYTCGRHLDVIAYFAEVASVSVVNAFFLLEKKYKVPRLKDDSVQYEKLSDDKPKTASLVDEFKLVEKMIVQNKTKYGREKFAKLLFVLDDALKNGKAENIARVKEKL